ncbi:hypothetical protein, partial [Enterobacter mori]|uniref:hypothetical protein n=1 Tax=Enterobacter mori TaxID=539813 RepID=UPI003B83BD3F
GDYCPTFKRVADEWIEVKLLEPITPPFPNRQKNIKAPACLGDVSAFGHADPVIDVVFCHLAS